jgi:UDP-GlcNAc:undecaprenyl-phosphate GlcNAc-1-phosphate transferase
MTYLFFFLLALALATIFTPFVRKWAFVHKILDFPSSSRKIHNEPMALLGGWAIYAAFFCSLLVYLMVLRPDFAVVPPRFFVSILAGGALLMLGGFLDDKYNLPPKILWLFPAAAALIVVLSGIGVGIKSLSNPFGASISLDYKIGFLPFSGIVMWLWMMGMIFTTKFLDGLDGLCSGIGLIGGLTMLALSLTDRINQPITAHLAVIFSGSVLGFLLFNFNPASIFLGESGSTFVGFMLGVLAIILGAKIATALLVMGIPILDVAWAIVRRLWYRKSPFAADRLHLHHRLLDIGFSQKQTVLILWGISAVFGSVAVFLQSLGKLVALAVLLCVMVFMAISVVILYKRKDLKQPDLLSAIDQKANN